MSSTGRQSSGTGIDGDCGVVDMLIVSNIKALERNKGQKTLPFVCERNYEGYSDFAVTITDTKTKKSTVISSHYYDELVKKVNELSPYGLWWFEPPTETDAESTIVAISALSYNFLGCVDTVEIVDKSLCTDDVSSIAWTKSPVFIRCFVDDLGSLVTVGIMSGDDIDDHDMVDCTIFDAICFGEGCVIKGNCFYLPAYAAVYIDNRKCHKDSRVCRVSCSDIKRACALVGKSRTLRGQMLPEFNTMAFT